MYTPRPFCAPRRALLVLPLDLPGGAERVVACAARALSAEPDWDVEVAMLGGRTTPFVAADCGEARVTYGSGGGKAGAELTLVPRLLGRSYDLVLSSHLRVNAALAAVRRSGILRTRRLVARESTVLADRSSGARFAAYRALYSLYGPQDAILAQTAYMAERVREIVPPAVRDSIIVAPNPVDVGAIAGRAAIPLESSLASALAAAPHIAWCGRLMDIKQPGRAVSALAHARRLTGADLRLMMIGVGPLEAQTRAIAEAVGLSGAVRFAGFQDNPFPLMAACPMGLLTSDLEGFPNVLLEMMACGVKHIVTTPCAGDLDTLEGVEVTADFSPEAIGETLASGWNSRADRRPLYAAALERRGPRSWIKTVIGGRGAIREVHGATAP